MKKVIFKILAFYKVAASPILHFAGVSSGCRFYPTCSEYCVLAVRRRGVPTGLALAAWRVLRCNPFSRGGIDLV